jgi:orotidine-5'-phosphate decarboxylase
VRSEYGPLAWGLDPSGAILDEWGVGDTPDGLDRFADIALSAAVGTVGLVKPQAAFYERHGWRGFRTLERLIADARSAGLLVIVDAKRGDGGTTNDAYAEAFLGVDAPLGADALTVHPYLGVGAMGRQSRPVLSAHGAGSETRHHGFTPSGSGSSRLRMLQVSARQPHVFWAMVMVLSPPAVGT